MASHSPSFEPDIANRLAFAAARLKADTDPPSLADFPSQTPRAARLRGASADEVVIDPVLGEPVSVAVGHARRDLRIARSRLEELRAEIIELWPQHGEELPPAA
ncbi:MAG: hypothetical protein ACR2HD_04160 [Solirubrobacteraceae bacterium]|nr:MAG: hypothetical protein DLM63_01625 [Solirubrobacterales bacterium]